MLTALLLLFLQVPSAPSGLSASVDPGSVPYATYVSGCKAKGLTPFDSASYYSYGFDTAKHVYCLTPSASPDFIGQQDWK